METRTPTHSMTRSTGSALESAGSVARRMRVEDGHCDECGDPFERFNIHGHIAPKRCPVCHPARASLEPVKAPVPDRPAAIDPLSALNDAGVNMHKYRDATLESFDASEDPHALRAAEIYIEEWRRTYGIRFAYRPWMYLFGEGSRVVGDGRRKEVVIGKTGNGKTHLPIAIARKLLEEGLLEPGRVMFAEMEEILMKSEATIRGGEDSEDRLVAQYAAPTLLIIDDCFVRSPTNHSMRLFLRILNKRAGRGLLMSSNLSLKTAKAQDSAMARIVDRILDECDENGRLVVGFSGRTRRTDKVLGIRRGNLQEVR